MFKIFNKYSLSLKVYFIKSWASPVSYTQLDVYKRQGAEEILVGSCSSQSSSVRDVKRQRFKARETAGRKHQWHSTFSGEEVSIQSNSLSAENSKISGRDPGLTAG